MTAITTILRWSGAIIVMPVFVAGFVIVVYGDEYYLRCRERWKNAFGTERWSVIRVLKTII